MDWLQQLVPKDGLGLTLYTLLAVAIWRLIGSVNFFMNKSFVLADSLTKSAMDERRENQGIVIASMGHANKNHRLAMKLSSDERVEFNRILVKSMEQSSKTIAEHLQAEREQKEYFQKNYRQVSSDLLDARKTASDAKEKCDDYEKKLHVASGKINLLESKINHGNNELKNTR